jgi:hypothetical protein
MSCLVRIEFPSSPDGEELLAFLRERGLDGRVVNEIALDVGYAQEESERLRSDIRAALRTWLAEHGSPLVPEDVGTNRCVLRPQGE